MQQPSAGIRNVPYNINMPKPIMKDTQFRALNRKHLIMMLSDQEKEIERLKSENGHLLTACRAMVENRGPAQGVQPYENRQW